MSIVVQILFEHKFTLIDVQSHESTIADIIQSFLIETGLVEAQTYDYQLQFRGVALQNDTKVSELDQNINNKPKLLLIDINKQFQLYSQARQEYLKYKLTYGIQQRLTKDQFYTNNKNQENQEFSSMTFLERQKRKLEELRDFRANRFGGEPAQSIFGNNPPNFMTSLFSDNNFVTNRLNALQNSQPQGFSFSQNPNSIQLAQPVPSGGFSGFQQTNNSNLFGSSPFAFGGATTAPNTLTSTSIPSTLFGSGSLPQNTTSHSSLSQLMESLLQRRRE